MKLETLDTWQTKARGDNDQEYQIYLACADDGKGGDLVLFRMSDAEDDVEPFEEGFKKWEAAGSLNRFMRQATGSGAQHGSGSGGGGAMPSNLVDALAEGARRRAGR